MSVLSHQGGLHRVLVEIHHYAAGLFVHLGRGAVVEDGDGAVLLAPGVVLVGEPGARTHLEVAPFAAKAPDDLAALAVHLVDGPGSLGVDEEVAVWFHLYGVDVEVVDRLLGIFPGPTVRFPHADVIEAVPLEEHLARFEVELLGYALPDRA